MMRFFSFTLALVFMTSISAQAAETQDLSQIYQEALSKDPVLSAARNSNRAMQEKLVQGQAQYLPTITFNAGATASRTDIKYIGNNTAFRNAGRENFEGYSY